MSNTAADWGSKCKSAEKAPNLTLNLVHFFSTLSALVSGGMERKNKETGIDIDTKGERVRGIGGERLGNDTNEYRRYGEKEQGSQARERQNWKETLKYAESE